MKRFNLIFFFPIFLFSTPSLDWIAQYLPSNPIIVEAGAHIGTDTQRMSAKWPNGTIYAFEPNPKLYPILQKNSGGSSNIHTFCLALGNRIGMADFYISKPIEPNAPGDASSSLFPPSKEHWRWSWIGFEEPISVLITTLDAWAEEHQVDHVDFLWLDMQGSEFQMLSACPEILKSVKVIQTEYSKLPYYEGTVLFDDLTKWLSEKGFKIVYEESELHGDAIYLRF